MEAIEEIEKKLTNYENQYISENQSLIEKINLYNEREKQYKEQIFELYNKIDEINIINENKMKKDELNYNLIKEENCQLKEDYIRLKNNFDLVKKELNKEISKNELLIDKYNKLSYLYEQKERENINYYRNNTFQNTEYNKNNFKNDLFENENEKDKILDYCNNTISMIIKWIETNFISLFNSNNFCNEEIPDNNSFINIDKNDLFIFDKLRDSLLQAKDIIDDYYYKINVELKKVNEKIIDIEKQNSEKYNYLENLYYRLCDEVNKEKYFDIIINNNNYENNESFYFKEIEYLINNIFILLKKVKESSFNQSLDKLIEDNIILNKENENCKLKIVDLYNDNKIIIQKNNELQNINEKLKQTLSKIFSNNNSNKNS
jgi:hypothetical protein